MAASRAKNTDPTAAMPTALPIRCPVCNTAPALPPRSSGTSARLSVWFGLITKPLPMPATSSAGAHAHPALWPGTK